MGEGQLAAFLEALLTRPPCVQREAVLHEVQAAAAWLGPRETVAFEIAPGTPGCRGTLCLWVTQTDLDEFSVVWTTRPR